MNQIPNIEETEKILWCVERMLDGTYKSAEHKKLDILNYLKRTLETHHQQLQKAREESRWQTVDEMKFISDQLNELDFTRILYQYEMSRHRNHSELDQDNK